MKQAYILLTLLSAPPLVALRFANHARRYLQQISTGDPSSWCTSSDFADWNCNCSQMKNGVGNITGCLMDEDCGKCNDPSSCLRVEAEATIVASDRYRFTYCYSFGSKWKLCLASALESGLTEDGCTFVNGGEEACCKVDESKECEASFCGSSLKGLDACDLMELTCPVIEEGTTSPVAAKASVAPKPSPAQTPSPATTKSPATAPSPAKTPSAPTTKPTVGKTEFFWPADMLECAVNATDECQTKEIKSKTGMWYSFIGNGNLLELQPLCQANWTNVTISIMSGGTCDELECLIPPRSEDFSSCANQTDRRLLDRAAPFEFQTMLNILYWIYLEGPTHDELFNDFPYKITELGIPPTGAPSSQPTVSPSVSPLPTVTATPTAFSEYPSTSPTKAPFPPTLLPTTNETFAPTLNSASNTPSASPSENAASEDEDDKDAKDDKGDEDDEGNASSQSRAGGVGRMTTGGFAGLMVGILILLCCCCLLLLILHRRRQEREPGAMVMDDDDGDYGEYDKENPSFQDEHVGDMSDSRYDDNYNDEAEADLKKDDDDIYTNDDDDFGDDDDDDDDDDGDTDDDDSKDRRW